MVIVNPEPMRFVALLFAGLFLAAIGRAGDEKRSAESVMESALDKLMLRGKEEHPWVALVDAPSQHFVQFTYEKGSLVVDVPLTRRTEEQQRKIEEVFRSIGVKEPVTLQGRDPKTLKSFTVRSYQAGFAKDGKRAALFAGRIFREVFGIEAPAITVQEGGG